MWETMIVIKRARKRERDPCPMMHGFPPPFPGSVCVYIFITHNQRDVSRMVSRLKPSHLVLLGAAVAMLPLSDTNEPHGVDG